MTMRGRIIVVEDDVAFGRTLAATLAEEGYDAVPVTTPEQGIETIDAGPPPDVVLTDLRLKQADGLAFMERAREGDPDLPVLVMTAFGSIAGALDAVRRGAFHYLTKPFKLDEMLLYVEKAVFHRRLLVEHARLRRAVPASDPTSELLGQGPAMQQLRALVARCAAAEAAVLVRGESGTGKELVARALHRSSGRAGGPFVAVNCTAIPESLMESELFGYEQGAFTGAQRGRRGLVEDASGGTLFLDELGDMPLPLQGKLLRALQSGAVRRVGATREVKVDVRVVAATHRNLEEEVAAGRFREDLYWRLNVLVVRVPPLRERREDIPDLAARFLARATPPGGSPPRVGREALALLAAHAWPGNVRQLENAMTRAAVLCGSGEVHAADLDFLGGFTGAPLDEARRRLPTLASLQEDYIRHVLAHTGGNRTRAAQILGVDASTLYRRLGPARAEPPGD